MNRKIYLLALLFPLSVGCNTLHKIPGLGGSHSEGPAQASIPDIYTITGTTTADYQTLYLPIGSLTDNRQVTAKIKRPGEDWHTLYVDPTYWWASEFNLAAGPPSDSFTFRHNVIKNGSSYTFPGPVAPIGTQYEIQSVRIGAGQLDLY